MNELMFLITLICARRGVQLVKVECGIRLGFTCTGTFVLEPAAANTFYIIDGLIINWLREAGEAQIETGYDALQFNDQTLPLNYGTVECDSITAVGLTGLITYNIMGQCYKITTKEP